MQQIKFAEYIFELLFIKQHIKQAMLPGPIQMLIKSNTFSLGVTKYSVLGKSCMI